MDDMDAMEQCDDAFVALPVFTPQHANVVAQVAASNPVSGIVGVVADASGMQTHLAIQSGANWVLNLLVHPSESLRVLQGLLLQHAAALRHNRGALAGAEGADHDPLRTAVPAHADPVPREDLVPDGDEELMKMLCDWVPVGEMARRYYCSERSMYRRIRRLYDALGVSTRKELRAKLLSSTSPGAASPARGSR
ncbi:hypothetical protein [Streptomyces sp. NPDC058874]|uniref:hypothetical protein n=1 Tax=unclassified Streptomyces TaxID=2593676 RepID=UPI00368BB5EE